METLSQKTVLITLDGKKYVLTDNMTLEDFLSTLDIHEKKMLVLNTTKNGFVLKIK